MNEGHSIISAYVVSTCISMLVTYTRNVANNIYTKKVWNKLLKFHDIYHSPFHTLVSELDFSIFESEHTIIVNMDVSHKLQIERQTV